VSEGRLKRKTGCENAKGDQSKCEDTRVQMDGLDTRVDKQVSFRRLHFLESTPPYFLVVDVEELEANEKSKISFVSYSFLDAGFNSQDQAHIVGTSYISSIMPLTQRPLVRDHR
jgi:hypothetical protein